MRTTNLYLMITLLIFLALIYAQIKLSAMDSKYFGLILPGINFILSLASLLGLITYESIGANTSTSILAMFLNLLITNIPTFIFLAIYFGVREKNRVNDQLNKMNIKDL